MKIMSKMFNFLKLITPNSEFHLHHFYIASQPLAFGGIFRHLFLYTSMYGNCFGWYTQHQIMENPPAFCYSKMQLFGTKNASSV